MNFYQTNFTLWKEHGMGSDVIEAMLPYEREVYIILLNNWIEKKNLEAKNQR